jgi:hypothetical protein
MFPVFPVLMVFWLDLQPRPGDDHQSNQQNGHHRVIFETIHQWFF